MPRRLFGTRGIRGPIATKVTPELMLKLGTALAAYVKKGEVVVGRDARTSGEMLTNALKSGLLSGGSDVADVGMVPSPCVGHAALELGAAAGAIVTASHNPAPDNGVAFYHGDGTEFTADDITALESLVLDKEPQRVPWDSIGSVRRHDAIGPYLESIKAAVKVKKGLKVVLDCANGAGSATTPLLLRELGCKVTTINSHPDGHFPGRPAEPQPWNLGDLMKTVVEVGADLGIAHDGDADRVAIVDEKGKFVKHDALIALFAEEAVKKKGGGKVITSINTSVCIEEVVARAGGKTIRTGLGMFTDEMLKHKAVFAGEPGKIVFGDLRPWADGPFAAAKLVELLSSEGKTVSQVFAERVPDYPMFHEDLKCPDGLKKDFMSRVKDEVLKQVGKEKVREILDVDGMRINLKDGSWVLVRVSGTEPKARVVVEARSQEELSRLKEIALGEAKKFLKR